MRTITILGSGTSTGVPLLGCKCSTCLSSHPHDKRLRTSLLMNFSKKRLLIDCGPDLRQQLFEHDITDIDGIFITHAHADHIHGIDDLKPLSFYRKMPLPLYCSPDTAQILSRQFPYIFNAPKKAQGVPKITLHEVSLNKSSQILGLDFFFFDYPHNQNIRTTGFYTQKFAYITDCLELSKTTLDLLKKQQLELLILDCLREEPHRSHLHLDRALEYASFIQAKKTGLIHFGHELSQKNIKTILQNRKLNHIFPTHDGQILSY